MAYPITLLQLLGAPHRRYSALSAWQSDARFALTSTSLAFRRWPHTGKLRTAVDCFSGTWAPFYDLYGQRYWYDLASDRMTMDVEEVRRDPAARVLQRCWRGFMWRERLLRVRRKFPYTRAPCSAAYWRLHRQPHERLALPWCNRPSNGALACLHATGVCL